jgi:hypothetical protein
MDDASGGGMTFRVRRIDPPDDAANGDARWDYADSFEIALDQPRDISAEQWLAAAIGQTPPAVRQLIRLIHRHVLRFDLDGSESSGPLGWTQCISTHDVVAMTVDGSLLRALLVTRRHTPTRGSVATYLYFHRPGAARRVWRFVQPIHLLVERRLVTRAARVITRTVGEAEREPAPEMS